MVTSVTLKNGATAPDVVVKTTMVALRTLQADDPIALYELASICKDPAHQPFGNTGQTLANLALLENGKPHSIVRDVVLSAVTISDLDITLDSPVA